MKKNETNKRKSDIGLFKNINEKSFNDDDVERLAEFIIKQDNHEGSTAHDPYWNNQCEVLLKALLLYIFHEIATEKQDYSMLLEMLDGMKAVEILFEELEKKKPDHIALKYYKEYNNISAESRISVLTTLRARLESLDIESLNNL